MNMLQGHLQNMKINCILVEAMEGFRKSKHTCCPETQLQTVKVEYSSRSSTMILHNIKETYIFVANMEGHGKINIFSKNAISKNILEN